MIDLAFLFDAARAQGKVAGVPMQRALYGVLRDATLTGKLCAGCRLPPSRTMASEFAVARNTVLYAYEQLATEGWVITTKQGTVVAALAAKPDTRTIARPATNTVPKLSRRVQFLGRTLDATENQRPFVPGLPSAEQIIAHCKEQLAAYKCPKSVDFITALPRNPSGKLLKRILREPYSAGRDRNVA